MVKLRGLTVSWVLGWGLAMPLAAPVLAQPITVDTTVAGPQPVVGANNGVPVVNIAQPGAGGVSNNAFTHFNVGPAGLVLNNSASDSPTQLAGQVSGNPMLGNGPAATILNQVTAPNPSQLLGTLEVAGQRANVIVANPAGITCNGCGFLNATRATLTTGRPQVGPDGRISFDVATGTILIDGAGLNAGSAHQANLSRVDLLARAIKINADIWAEHLNVVTGANQVDYGSEQVRAKISNGDKPDFALDTAALGSMYANSIRLIGTEAGLGVNLRGRLTAMTGEIKLNAAGEVRITPTAVLKAGGNLEIEAAADLNNAGKLLTDFNQASTLNSGGAITLRSVEGKLVNTGQIASSGDLNARINYELNNAQGSLYAEGAVSLDINHLVNTDGVIAGKTVLATIHSARSRPKSGYHSGYYEFESGGVDNTRGLIQAEEALTLSTRSLTNVNTQSSDASRPLGLVGKTITLNPVTLHGGSLGHAEPKYWSDFNNTQGSVLASEMLALRVDKLSNHAGVLSSSGSADIDVGLLDNLNAYSDLSNPFPGKISTGGRLSINACALGGGGVLRSENDLLLTIHDRSPNARSLHQGKLINHNKLFAVGDLTVVNLNSSALALENAADGQWVAQGDTTLDYFSSVLINKGLIEGRVTRIKTADVINKTLADGHQTAAIEAREDLNIVTRTLDNDTGKLSAGKSLTISPTPGLPTWQGAKQPSLNNPHGQIAAPHVVIKLSELDNPGGQILGDQVSIEAARLTNRAGSPGGVIAARQALNLGVKELNNGAHALLYSQGDLSIGGALDENNQAVGVAQTIVNTGGIIDAHGKVVAQARTITNGQGATVLAGHTVLWPKEALSNDANSQVITGDFLLDTDRFTNTGRLEARTIAMTVNHFDNVGKLVRADQHLQLQGKGPESTLDNRQGLLLSAGSLALKFDRFDNTQGTVLAAGDGDVHIGQMLGSGRWILGGKLDLQSPGSWTQDPDALMDAGHLYLRLGSLDNQGGVYGDTVSLEAPHIDNQGGVIAARSRLELGVGTLTNHAQGWIASADRFTLGGALDGAGRAVGQAQRVQNRGATLESLGDFTLTAVQFANENARLETAQGVVAGPASHRSIQPKKEEERIDSSRLIEITVNNRDRYAIYPPATAPPPFSYAQLRSWVDQTVGLDRRINKNDPEIDQALQAIREQTRDGLVPLAHLKKLAQALKQLGRYPALEETVRELAVKGKDSQHELWVAHRAYAPLIDLAWQHSVWKRPVQEGLFKAETGGPIELLKTWRRLENRPVIDNDPRWRFWGHAAAGEPPVLPLLPRLTQLGYLTPDQASQAQSYYASQILAEPRWAREWREFETQRTVTETQVTHSEPGQVLAGGNLNLAIGEQGLNSNSHILAGGKLTYTGQDLTLESAKSERLLHETGQTWQAYIRGGGSGPLKRTKGQPYEPGPILLSSTPIAQVAEHTDVAHSPRTIAARRLEATLPAQAHAPEVDPAYRVTSWTQADGAQVRQLDGIAVPYSALYRPAPEGSASLYQTEPAFLSGQTQPGLPGLGTLLQALDRPSSGLPSVVPLGDGFMESRLVRDQAMALTGQRFLPGFDNDQRAYRALLSQTAVLAYPGNWPVGEPLSASVIQTLPYSVVWPVRQAVIGPDGKSVQALMPTLYLRESAPSVLSAVSHVSAPDILLQLAGKLDQDGRLQAQRSLSLQAQDLALRGDVTGQTVSTHSKGDTQILGGQLTAEKALGVTAEGTVTIASTVHHTADRTQLERIATLTTTEAGAPIDVQSQGDIRIDAGQLQSAGDLSIQSQGHVQFTAQTERWQETITFGRKNALHQAREEDLGSALNAQGAIYVEAGGDIAGRAVNLVAQDDLSLRAQGAITFEAGQIHTTLDDQWYSRDRGFLSSSESTFKWHEDARRAQPSTITGETVELWAGEDLRLTGSHVGAQRDLTLEAQQQVAITPAVDTVHAWVYEQTRQSGFGALEGLSYGQRKQTDRRQRERTDAAPSMVGSVEGDVRIHAGEALVVVGSRVLALEGDVTLMGKQVTLDAAHNTLHEQASHEIKESGLTVTANTPVINALQVGQRMGRAVGQLGGAADNPVMTALAGVTTGLAAKNAYDAVMKDPQHLGGASVVLSVGSSQSRSETERTASWVQGSTVAAGEDLTVLAQGAGQDSDLTVTGSTLSAGQTMALVAEGDILLQAGQNQAEQRTHSQSSSASIGLGISLGKTTGMTAELGASGARGNTDGQDAVWTNSQVTAGQTLILNAGRDLTLKGAQGQGEQIVAKVGGDLLLESLQDTHTYRGKQDSHGFSASLCIPPFCKGVGPTAGNSIAGNVGRGRMKSDFRSVADQSGLWASDGGFEIDVKDHTRLIGAVIASSEQAVADGRNQLATGTLSTEDIENQAQYSASQVSLGAGFTWGGQSSDLGTTKEGQVAGGASKEHGSSIPTSKNGLGVGMPMVAAASDESYSTTQSAINGGTIVIRDEAAQQDLTGMTPNETIASLNRDTTSTEHALKPIFDKEKIEAGFEIVTAFQQQAGQFLTNRAQEIDALKIRSQNPDLTPAEREQALAAAFKLEGQWGPSGAYRRVLSALSAGAAGDVTGSSGAFMQSAAVNYLQGLAASEVKKIADSLGQGPKAEAVRTSLHTIVGCAGAAASNGACSAGALGAGVSSVLNALLNAQSEALSGEEREAQANLVTSLVSATALATGAEAITAMVAARTETENNALELGELDSFGIEASRCEARGNCDQVRKYFQQLSIKNRDEIISLCAQDLAQCREKYGGFIEDITKYRQKFDALSSMDLPSGFKIDLAFHLMQYHDAINVMLVTELASHLKERYGLNAEQVTQAASVAMGAVGAVKGSRNTAKIESLAVKGDVKSLPSVIEPQIGQQLTQRGWSEETINGVIAHPTKTVVTKDTRWDLASGTRLNDPATGYIARDGAYVIRNDRTGVIVEVSNRNNHNGVAFWRNGKDGIATFETAGAKTGVKVEEKFAGRTAKTEGVSKVGGLSSTNDVNNAVTKSLDNIWCSLVFQVLTGSINPT